MRINILAIESKRPAWAQKAFESYQDRFDGSIQIEWSGIKPEKHYKSLDTKKIINDMMSYMESRNIWGRYGF